MERLGCRGGFVGVDVFFVISGYVITRQLAERIPSLSLGAMLVDFYYRRIKRIVPALALVLSLSLIAGYALLMPGDFADVGQSAAYSAFGIGNFYFFGHTGYFDRDADLQPLLHMWSLGVEEQFYMGWPLLLAGFIWLARGRTAVVAALIAGLLILSFAASALTVLADPKAAFYLPHTRAWELAAGALLVFLPAIRFRLISEIMGVAGAGLVAFGLLALNAGMPFPGLNAVPPVLGAALLIWPRTRTMTADILSLGPMRLIGKISYSLYLWHWPVLVFFRHYAGGDPPTPIEAIGLGVLSVTLSVVSWYFVEERFRKIRRQQVTVILAGLAAVFVTAVAGALVLLTGGFQDRIPLSAQGMTSLEAMWEWKCPQNVYVEELGTTLCAFGAPWEAAKRRGILWGDSHAEHFAPLLEAAARGTGTSFLLYGRCPAALGGAVYRERKVSLGYREQCAEERRRVLSLLNARADVELVILSAAWEPLSTVVAQDGSLPTDDGGIDLVRAGLNDFLTKAAASDRRFLLLGQVPSVPVDPVPCSLSSLIQLPRRDCAIGAKSWAYYSANQAKVDDELEALVKDRPDIRFVSPGAGLCREGSCLTMLSGIPLYRDGSHIRRNLPPRILREIGDRIGLTRSLLALLNSPDT